MEWRIAHNHENYEVSDDGRVRRRTDHKLSGRWPVGRELTQNINKYGYARVKVDGKHVFVAKLVAETFICPRPDNMQVNHISGVKTDNRVVNLEWVTRKENIRHAIDNGLMTPVRGERHGNSKLTEKAVRHIRSVKGQTKMLSERYGVDKSLIKLVRQNKIWKHVKWQ